MIRPLMTATLIVLITLVTLGASSIIVRVPSTTLFAEFRTNNTDKGYLFDEVTQEVTILAVPLQFESNTVDFAPVSTTLLSENLSRNSTLSSICRISRIGPANGFRRLELWIGHVWGTSFIKPAALIAFGGPYGAGGYQVNRFRDVSLEGVSCPVVHMTEVDGSALATLLQRIGEALNITITNSPSNEYLARRNSPGYIVYSVLLLVAALICFGISLTALLYRGIKHNIPTLCLVLDLTAAIVRFMFALDPFADRFFPAAVVEIFFTAYVPMFISSTVLIAMFWHELATQASMEITGGLTRLKIPAVIVITILFLLEIVSSSLRAVKLPEADFVQQINAVYYVIVILLMIGYYCYVSIKVFLFLRGKTKLRKNDKILRDFSIRAFTSMFGLLVFLIAPIGYAAGLAVTSVSEAVLNFIAHASGDWISGSQSMALLSSWRASMKKSSTASSSKSARVDSQSSTVWPPM